MEKIEGYCFADCKKLASISFPPEQLREIANNAFENCVKLDLPDLSDLYEE